MYSILSGGKMEDAINFLARRYKHFKLGMYYGDLRPKG